MSDKYKDLLDSDGDDDFNDYYDIDEDGEVAKINSYSPFQDPFSLNVPKLTDFASSSLPQSNFMFSWDPLASVAGVGPFQGASTLETDYVDLTNIGQIELPKYQPNSAAVIANSWLKRADIQKHLRVTFGETTTHYFEKDDDGGVSHEEKLRMLFGKDPNDVDDSEEEEVDTKGNCFIYYLISNVLDSHDSKFAHLANSDFTGKEKVILEQRLSDIEQFELNETPNEENSDGFQSQYRHSESLTDLQEYKTKWQQMEAKIETLIQEKSFFEFQYNNLKSENTSLKELESENSILRIDSNAAEDSEHNLYDDLAKANAHIIKLNAINSSIKRKVDEIVEIFEKDDWEIDNAVELINQLQQFVDSTQGIHNAYKTQHVEKEAHSDKISNDSFDDSLLDDHIHANRSQEIKW